MFAKDQLFGRISGGPRSTTSTRIYRTLTETHDKALIPAITYFTLRTDVLHGRFKHHGAFSPSISQKPSIETAGAKRMLTFLTISAAIVLKGSSNTAAVLALGCCDALLVAEALSFLQDAQREATETGNSSGTVVAANDLLAHPNPTRGVLIAVVHDVAVAATATLWLAAFLTEDLTFTHFRYGPALAEVYPSHTILGRQMQTLIYGFTMVLVHVTMNASLILAVRLNIHSLSLICVDAQQYCLMPACMKAFPSFNRSGRAPSSPSITDTDTDHSCGAGHKPRPIVCCCLAASCHLVCTAQHKPHLLCRLVRHIMRHICFSIPR